MATVEELRIAGIASIIAERARQEEKWGEQNHNFPEWIAILTEEVGEAAQESLRIEFGGRERHEALREELVHVAAVALQIIEKIDL